MELESSCRDSYLGANAGRHAPFAQIHVADGPFVYQTVKFKSSSLSERKQGNRGHENFRGFHGVCIAGRNVIRNY